MDGTAMDSICMSTFPFEQFIPQKENTNNGNEKSIAKLEHILDSTDRCTQRELNIDSGAGANAGSMAEITFKTNTPLSELVWSPRKGLSLKFAGCNLTEKKSSLFWSSESGNMIISSPANVKAWESYSNATVAVGDLRSTHLVTNPESENSNRETLVRFPKSTVDIIPPSQTRVPDLNMRSCGDMEPLRTMKVSTVDVKCDEGDWSAKKQMAAASTRDIQVNVDLYKGRMVTAATLPDQASLPGPDNIKGAASLSVKPKNVKFDLLPAEPHLGDFSEGSGTVPFERSGEIGSGNIQGGCVADTLFSENSTVKRYNLPGSSMPISRSLDIRYAEPDLFIEENNRHKIVMNPRLIEIPCVNKLESTAENDVELLKVEGTLHSQYFPSKSEAGGSSCAEMGMIVAYHVEDEGKHSSPLNALVPPMDDKAALIEASPNNSRRRGKEKALSDTEVDRIISKVNDDSQESVKSCDSRGLLSEGKRASSFEPQLVIGNKKIKKQCHETLHSASFFGQDSPFTNWISNMAKGFSKFDMDGAPSLAVSTKPSHQRNRSHDSPSTSCDKNKKDPGCSHMGFQNVLQAWICPSSQLEDKKTAGFDDLTGARISKDLDAANKILCDVSPHGDFDMGTLKLHKFIPKSNEKSQVGEFPSIQPTIVSSGNTEVPEKRVRNFLENHNLCSLACGLETGGIHSSKSSLCNDSGFPHEGEGAREIISVDPNAFVNLVTNESKPRGSLWITRFSPKDSGPVLNSMQTDCNSLFPHSQNAVFPLKDQNNLEIFHESSAEDHMHAQSKKVQNHSVSPSISCGTKQMDVCTNHKFKSKLGPILPSQRFNNSDSMFSSFARRLDALRHIIPLKVTDSAARAATFCCFCGIRGHTLNDCLEIGESELKDLLKNVNLYDGAEETSCVCIKCFQISHWAIACPHASSRKQINTHGNSSWVRNKNCDRIRHNPQIHSLLTDHDRRTMLQSEIMDGKRQLVGAYSSSLGEHAKENEFMVQTNGGTRLNETMVLNGRFSDLKPVKKDLPRDVCHGVLGKRTSSAFIEMGKNTVSSSENGPKENQITPFYNDVYRQIPDVPQGTFDAIRKLRLSRTDILKWTKSSISDFCLEGYFVRLRLGKWEERLGGSGYQVACISGESQVISCNICKFPVSVDMGGLKSFVDCRYVSNHDFIEDELMAWWCATLRGDGKVPSEEDLSVKLVERKRYGF